MSFYEKQEILIDYFRKNDEFPKGCVTIDQAYGTVSNVSVDGCFYGVFDFVKKDFIDFND